MAEFRDPRFGRGMHRDGAHATGGAGGRDGDDPADGLRLLAVAVGNTRTRLGLFVGRSLLETAVVDSRSPGAAAEAARAMVSRGDEAPAAAVLASVNPPADGPIAQALRDGLPHVDLYRVGREVPIPLTHALDDASTLGQDRALCALAAFDRARQACVVADVGTAVTVDFVDGEGTYHGGVIAPGLHMMLRSLHEHTAALPSLGFEAPDPQRGPFGRDTAHAMRLGVVSAVRGLVRDCLDRYAAFYEGYPQVIATGGDAAVLEESEGVVEHFVPELQLMGIRLCATRALLGDEGDDEDGE